MAAPRLLRHGMRACRPRGGALAVSRTVRWSSDPDLRRVEWPGAARRQPDGGRSRASVQHLSAWPGGMMAAATWADLVTTALLGTDRRPVPDDLPGTWAGPVPRDDPARRILDLAAQYRAWSRAGTRLQATEPPPRAPAADGTSAPAAAH